MSIAISLQADRAFISIGVIEFEPSVPVADKRIRIAIMLKNSGRNRATIEGMATDRLGKLPPQPKYELTNIAHVDIPTGGDLRVISDLGVKPLILAQAELNSLKDGSMEFIVAGFIKYSDVFSWFLGTTVLGYCYVWDPKDTSVGNFSVCPEKAYVYTYRYWLWDGIPYQEVPMIGIGTRTVSPTTAPIRVPDPQFPIKRLETK